MPSDSPDSPDSPDRPTADPSAALPAPFQHLDPDELDPPPTANKAHHGSDEKYAGALEGWARRNPSYFASIDWSRYIQPPVLMPLWGYHESRFRGQALGSLLYYTSAAGRRLTDDEKDVLMRGITRGTVGALYDRPFAVGLTALLAARSWRRAGLQAGMGNIHFAERPGLAGQVAAFFKRAARPSMVCAGGMLGYYFFGPVYQGMFMTIVEDDCLSTEPHLEHLVRDMHANQERDGKPHKEAWWYR